MHKVHFPQPARNRAESDWAWRIGLLDFRVAGHEDKNPKHCKDLESHGYRHENVQNMLVLGVEPNPQHKTEKKDTQSLQGRNDSEITCIHNIISTPVAHHHGVYTRNLPKTVAHFLLKIKPFT